MKLYTFKDNKLGAFEHPVISMALNDEVMFRAIQTQVSCKALPVVMADHPKDFELYCLGEIDQATGAITPACDFICYLEDILGDRKNG